MITGTGLRVSLRKSLYKSDHSLQLRRSPFYPLNYGGVGVDSRDWVGLGVDGLICGSVLVELCFGVLRVADLSGLDDFDRNQHLLGDLG